MVYLHHQERKLSAYVIGTMINEMAEGTCGAPAEAPLIEVLVSPLELPSANS